MRIHTDHNGVAVNAIYMLADGTVVEGHVYQVLAGPKVLNVEFQLGPVKENGVTGVTNEALLAIVLHRLRFLDSKFPCAENTVAIGGLMSALEALERRTQGRIARGVEGLNKE